MVLCHLKKYSPYDNIYTIRFVRYNMNYEIEHYFTWNEGDGYPNSLA
jgi:hypothetical protein